MTSLSTSGARREGGRSAASPARLKRSYSLIQALGVLLILIVIMQIVNDRFLSPANVSNLLGQMTVMLIVAAGMTIVMISGEFDVSVGSVVGLSAAVGGWIMVRWIPAASSADHSWWVIALGLIAPLFVGPLLGLIVGVIVTKAKIPSFIVTLGTLMMARSLTLVVTRGQPIPDMPQGVAWFGQGRWVQIPLPVNFAGWLKSGESLDRVVSGPEHRLDCGARLCGRLVRPRTHDVRQARLCGRRQPDGRDAVRHPHRLGQDPMPDDRRLHRLARGSRSASRGSARCRPIRARVWNSR